MVKHRGVFRRVERCETPRFARRAINRKWDEVPFFCQQSGEGFESFSLRFFGTHKRGRG